MTVSRPFASRIVTGASPCTIGPSGNQGWSEARCTSIETEQRCIWIHLQTLPEVR